MQIFMQELDHKDQFGIADAKGKNLAEKVVAHLNSVIPDERYFWRYNFIGDEIMSTREYEIRRKKLIFSTHIADLDGNFVGYPMTIYDTASNIEKEALEQIKKKESIPTFTLPLF